MLHQNGGMSKRKRNVVPKSEQKYDREQKLEGFSSMQYLQSLCRSLTVHVTWGVCFLLCTWLVIEIWQDILLRGLWSANNGNSYILTVFADKGYFCLGRAVSLCDSIYAMYRYLVIIPILQDKLRWIVYRFRELKPVSKVINLGSNELSTVIVHCRLRSAKMRVVLISTIIFAIERLFLGKYVYLLKPCSVNLGYGISISFSLLFLVSHFL